MLRLIVGDFAIHKIIVSRILIGVDNTFRMIARKIVPSPKTVALKIRPK
jgi:hypothetical protein